MTVLILTLYVALYLMFIYYLYILNNEYYQKEKRWHSLPMLVLTINAGFYLRINRFMTSVISCFILKKQTPLHLQPII